MAERPLRTKGDRVRGDIGKIFRSIGTAGRDFRRQEKEESSEKRQARQQTFENRIKESGLKLQKESQEEEARRNKELEAINKERNRQTAAEFKGNQNKFITKTAEEWATRLQIPPGDSEAFGRVFNFIQERVQSGEPIRFDELPPDIVQLSSGIPAGARRAGGAEEAGGAAGEFLFGPGAGRAAGKGVGRGVEEFVARAQEVEETRGVVGGALSILPGPAGDLFRATRKLAGGPAQPEARAATTAGLFPQPQRALPGDTEAALSQLPPEDRRRIQLGLPPASEAGRIFEQSFPATEAVGIGTQPVAESVSKTPGTQPFSGALPADDERKFIQPGGPTVESFELLPRGTEGRNSFNAIATEFAEDISRGTTNVRRTTRKTKEAMDKIDALAQLELRAGGSRGLTPEEANVARQKIQQISAASLRANLDALTAPGTGATR